MYVSVTSTNVIYICNNYVIIRQDQPKDALTLLVLFAHVSHQLMPPAVRTSTTHLPYRLAVVTRLLSVSRPFQSIYTHKLLATKTCIFVKGANFDVEYIYGFV